MRTFKTLNIEIDADEIAIVTMNRPPANAVDQPMYRELTRYFSEPDEGARKVKAIVLTGAGKHFCAGNDLDEFATMTPDNGSARMWEVRRAFFAIQDCAVPVIGAVRGAALGTGLAIAASCDFVIAARDASLGLPELTVGVMGGARHLARMAPQPLVRRMFLTGEAFTAEDFVRHGGSLFLSDPEALIADATKIAARIASFSPTAVRIGKRVLNRIEEMDLRAGYEFEQGFTVRMSGHPDSKEALAAFRERRAPLYEALTQSDAGL